MLRSRVREPRGPVLSQCLCVGGRCVVNSASIFFLPPLCHLCHFWQQSSLATKAAQVLLPCYALMLVWSTITHAELLRRKRESVRFSEESQAQRAAAPSSPHPLAC